MKKNGHHPSGRQRWYCPSCRFSTIRTDTRQTRLKEYREFLAYITDTAPRRANTTTLRSWDRAHAWCWHTRPKWEQTGEIYDQIFIDGTYLPHGWCVLIASTSAGVVAYQLCAHETKAAYHALLDQIPAPIIVTTDGGAGALAAIQECWPTSHVQRCLVHVQRNIRRVTTTRPRIKPHKALYHLGLRLTRITSITEAVAWQESLAAFHMLYENWLNERTYRDQVPASQIPSFARHNKNWWHTHSETRSVVKSLDRLVKDGVLFTYLDPTLETTTPLASTTNTLEGGINAPLKAFLHAHRGWAEDHMLTALDFWLYHRSINAQPLETFMTNTVAPRRTKTTEPDPGPVEIDTHINTTQPWEDGITIHKGWIRN